MLELKDVSSGYGSIQVLREISFQVPEGQIVSLIGANGAGKTTTMRTIIGLLKAQSGSIHFRGQDVTRWPTYQLVDQGISLVPEGRQIISSLTVAENLDLGAYRHKDQTQIKADMEKVFEIFPILEERADQLGGTLSGGQQQMLAMARALMNRPKLILLDEPSMGLAPLVVKEIFEIIQRVNEDGTTVLVVEQNAKKALSIADYAYVLETGKIVLEGPAGEIAANPAVKEAYLGG